MKKYLLALSLIIFVAPSIALASWWNPFSWSIFHKKETVPQIQVETQKTSEEKISELQKQLYDLKKEKLSSDLTATPKPKEVKKSTAVINTTITKETIDVCPEIEGIQNIVPIGYVKYGTGPCVLTNSLNTIPTIQIPITQNTITSQQEEHNKAVKQLEDYQKQLLLAEIKTNCTDPINQWKIAALQLKADYPLKLKALNDSFANTGATYSGVQPSIAALERDTNSKIDALNIQIQQKSLECSIKYGL